jgi:hypothetical protein
MLLAWRFGPPRRRRKKRKKGSIGIANEANPLTLGELGGSNFEFSHR